MSKPPSVPVLQDPIEDLVFDLLDKLIPRHYADSGSRERFLADMLADGYMFRVGPYVIGIAAIDREDEV